MERLFEPQFQLHALTAHPQFLPDTLIVPSHLRTMCCRGRDETGEDKGPEQHRFRWWLTLVDLVLSGIPAQEDGDKGKKHLACSLFLLFDMWVLGELHELQMAACDACLLRKRRKVGTGLPSFLSISTCTCYGSSFLDKCTKKRKGWHENLAHVRIFEWSKWNL